ncbi:sugar phosphate isomerase/epimerase family protein [Leptolyngbya sp. AN03gr2]|uniref:sugar phosphate isomerase/epimerase family protein n=1 Tax=unclassified Leptolyngbya TaxID=2650499 RepID=UPI003D317C88
MNDLWISLSTYGGVTTRTALGVLWAAGIRQVELAVPWLSRSEFGVKPSVDTTAVLQHYRQLGVQYRTHHAIVWQEHRAATQIPQGSFNLANQFDGDYFERLSDWLAVMQITAYSVHAGRIDTAVPEMSTDHFLENLAQLAQLCRDRAIRLGVETMYPSLLDCIDRHLMQNGAEIEQFLAILPNVDLVIDLAHLNLWRNCSNSEKLQVLHRAGDRLLELHISDNDGIRDNHTQISDTTWWVPYVGRFPREVPIVLESRMNHYTPEQVRQHVEHASRVLKASRPSVLELGNEQ